jgi:hypothetical protein
MMNDRDEVLRPDPVAPPSDDVGTGDSTGTGAGGDPGSPVHDGARELPDEDVSPSAGAPEPPD